MFTAHLHYGFESSWQPRQQEKSGGEKLLQELPEFSGIFCFTWFLEGKKKNKQKKGDLDD